MTRRLAAFTFFDVREPTQAPHRALQARAFVGPFRVLAIVLTQSPHHRESGRDLLL